MIYSVSLYSFSSAYKSGTLTPLTAIAAAKDIGFGGVELCDFHFDSSMPKAEFAKLVLDECERQGMAITNLAVGADFINKDTAAEIARVKEMIDIAKGLGCPRLRTDMASYKRGISYGQALPTLIKAAVELSQYGQEKGVEILTENHGIFSQDSQRLVELWQGVGHPNFGLLCDMGNFACADETVQNAVAIVAPFARYVHAKDFYIRPANATDPGRGFFRSRAGRYLRGAIVGQGDLDISACLYALARAEYKGDIAIEFEGLEDCMTGLEAGLLNLKRMAKAQGLDK